MTLTPSPPTLQQPPAPTSEPPSTAPQSRRTRRRGPTTTRRVGWLGAGLLGLVVLTAVLAPILAPYDPTVMSAGDRLLPPVWSDGGSSTYLLGTDNLGRDILSRLIYGTQLTLLVSGIATIIAAVLGTALGLLCGYRAGSWIDAIVMRIVDASMAIPNILLVLVVVGALGTSATTLTLILGITGWIPFTRMIRSEVLSLRERDYVRAAHAIGLRDTTIVFKHILPNVAATIIVLATLAFGGNIVLEASLSFLGLGIQPPQVTWGYMLNEGRDYLATAWWISTFPGIAITLTVLGVLFTGDWLRDVLDPRGSTRRTGRKEA
ncbi:MULTISPECIES: ABC transporter permease [Rhodococcus]|nr:ABC transporter permease [Rhodococcus sp. PD04]MDC3728081.1 ABC transporter permease [Rhodococcus sp. Rp3]WSE25395.1 ABC transporter permease [Rhodococcus sp. PD04]